MKALTVIGAAVGSGILLLGSLPPVVLVGGAALVGLVLVWWLTDSPLGVSRHPHPTWFDGPRPSPLVVRGAVRAGATTDRR